MISRADDRYERESFCVRHLPMAARLLRERWMQVTPPFAIAMFSLSLLVAAGGDARGHDTRTQLAIQAGAVRSSESRIPDTAHRHSPSATPNLDSVAASSWEGEAPSATLTRATSANYMIDWYSINAGGTVDAQSANYLMGASVAQPIAGSASSANFQMGIGFWYGVDGEGSCGCDCHGDPVCDGNTDVLDVVQSINVAFRGAPSIIDPNAGCPNETTDLDCSHATDVLDVVKMLNVAFRGASSTTELCNPCLSP